MSKAIALLLVVTGCSLDRNHSIEAMNRGVEFGRQKLFDSAIKEFQTATALDPTNAAAFYNLGVVYKDKKAWPEAAKAFSEAGKIDSTNPALQYELGNALFEDKKLAEAQKAFEDAIKLDPKLYKAHYRLGVVMQTLAPDSQPTEEQAKNKAADIEYRKAIEANPRFVQAYVKLGDLYLDNEYDKEAAQVFRNAIVVDDHNADAHMGLGEALENQKQYEEAIKEFQAARDIDSRQFLAVYNMGHTYKLLGDKKKAKEMLQTFVKDYAATSAPELVRVANDELYALDAP